MRNIWITILFLLALNSCSTDNKPKSGATLNFRNNLTLLNHFGLGTKTNLDLFELKDSAEEKLKRYFQYPFCDQLRYSVNYQVCERVNIPIMVQSHYYQHCSSKKMRCVISCDVLLNCQGKVLFDGESCKMETVGDKIVAFYKNQDVTYGLNKAIISFHWDKDGYEKYFRQAVNQIIKGYFEYAEIQSRLNFHKAIFELNTSELKTLGKILPFNFCIDFIEVDLLEMDLIDLPVKVCSN